MSVQKIINALNRLNKTACSISEGQEPEMASLTNGNGLILSPLHNFPFFSLIFSSTVLDAAGESASLIGRIKYEGTDSKTISSAGGNIYVNIGNPIVFANAGTTLRAGVQDLAATGLEDGTFDVYGDLVGGTDTITQLTVIQIPMESGSKVINNGDLISINFELISKAGVDSVVITRRTNGTYSFPYGTQDVGAGPTKMTTAIVACIEFDDGTLGYINDIFPAINTPHTFSDDTDPDEYALVFSLPFAADLSVINLLGIMATDTDTELVIYSDPLNVPVEEFVITVDKDTNSGVFSSVSDIAIDVIPAYRLSANTLYAISMRQSVFVSLLNRIGVLDFFYAPIKDATPLGQDWSLGHRTDRTGPFILTQTKLPTMSLYLNNISSA